MNEDKKNIINLVRGKLLLKNRLVHYASAIQGKEELKVGPASVAEILIDAASYIEAIESFILDVEHDSKLYKKRRRKAEKSDSLPEARDEG